MTMQSRHRSIKYFLKMSYKHPEWKHIPKQQWIELLDKVNCYNTFNSRVVRFGEDVRIGIRSYSSMKGLTDLALIGNEAIGNIFEAVMGEHFLTVLGPSIGIHNYNVTTIHDWGVDGIGKGNDNKIKPVQLKMRSNGQLILRGREDHLDNFLEEGIWRYGVDPSIRNSFLVVTNALKVDYRDCIYRWKRAVSYIAPNESFGLLEGKKYTAENPIRINSIRMLVDNCIPFWDSLRTFIS